MRFSQQTSSDAGTLQSQLLRQDHDAADPSYDPSSSGFLLFLHPSSVEVARRTDSKNPIHRSSKSFAFSEARIRGLAWVTDRRLRTSATYTCGMLPEDPGLDLQCPTASELS